VVQGRRSSLRFSPSELGLASSLREEKQTIMNRDYIAALRIFIAYAHEIVGVKRVPKHMREAVKSHAQREVRRMRNRREDARV
jgi:hypothetical protein